MEYGEELVKAQRAYQKAYQQLEFAKHKWQQLIESEHAEEFDIDEFRLVTGKKAPFRFDFFRDNILLLTATLLLPIGVTVLAVNYNRETQARFNCAQALSLSIPFEEAISRLGLPDESNESTLREYCSVLAKRSQQPC